MIALAKSIVNMVAKDAAAARRRQRRAGVLAGDRRCAAVLGALGCGAFKNPPAEVAAAFNVALRQLAMPRDGGDAGVDLVAFAIVNDHNSPQGETSLYSSTPILGRCLRSSLQATACASANRTALLAAREFHQADACHPQQKKTPCHMKLAVEALFKVSGCTALQS